MNALERRLLALEQASEARGLVLRVYYATHADADADSELLEPGTEVLGIITGVPRAPGAGALLSGPLERRLERLKAEAGIGASYPAIFVHFGRPGASDSPVATAAAAVSGRIWYRAPGGAGGGVPGAGGAEARCIRLGGVVVAFLD
jgi:hypothetical protein